MKRLLQLLIFINFSFSGYSQETTTIRLIDSLTKKSIEKAQVFCNDTTLISNQKGYCQFESSEGDTVTIVHENYEESVFIRPANVSFSVALNIKSMSMNFSGGTQSFYKQLGEKLEYPNTARKKGLEKNVFVQFQIDSVGKMNDILVYNDPEEIFSKQIIKTFKGIKGTWGAEYENRTFLVPIQYRFGSSSIDQTPNNSDNLSVDKILTEVVITAMGY